MGLFSSLNRDQKEALTLLQIGTFLEYFDLMLYIHMAVLLNELFFPKTDPQTAALLSAFAFCSSFAVRPIGALIFGWLGDNIGRKSTIILTTATMSISCLIMANVPTYAQIGITAAWIMIFCRMAQGMSSMGEIVGAEIYIAETIPRPTSYPAVAFMAIAANMGSMVALGISFLATSLLFNWRIAFWVGAAIALIGSVARTRLRETPDFLDMKRKQMKQTIAELNQQEESKNNKDISQQKSFNWKEPIKAKTLVAYSLIYCGWPLTFYLAYMYFNPLLKETFGYSAADIIKHNFFLSMILLLSQIFWTLLSYQIHPLKILKIRGTFILSLMLLLPFLIINSTSNIQIFLIQASLLVLAISSVPADAVLIYHLPVYRRFTLASLMYAVAHALVYITTSFALVYLGHYFGPYGIWFIALPISFSYLGGVLYFENLERKLGFYPQFTPKDSLNPGSERMTKEALNSVPLRKQRGA